MKSRGFLLVATVLFSTGCATTSNKGANPNSSHYYSGAASISDFLIVTLDPVCAHLGVYKCLELRYRRCSRRGEPDSYLHSPGPEGRSGGCI